MISSSLSRLRSQGSGTRCLSPRGYIQRLTGLLITFSMLFLFFEGGSAGTLNSRIGNRTRVVVIGDLHGDVDSAIEVLRMADVINEKVNTEGKLWSGNVNTLVQVGDILDRGNDTIQLYQLMERLREEAEEAGGKVVSLLGNHEFMNCLGDWRHVTSGDVGTFGSVANRQYELTQGKIGQDWAKHYVVASRISLHPAADGPPPSSFRPPAMEDAALSVMHGGLSPDFAHPTPFPSRINELGESLLRRCQTRRPQPPPDWPPPNEQRTAQSYLPPDTTQGERDLYARDGPLWYRGWAKDDERVVCSRVDGVLKRIGVRRLIMGHTPNPHGIQFRCNGKIILVDTAFSLGYKRSGPPAALEITYSLERQLESYISLVPAGMQRVFGSRVPTSDKKRLWKETEVVRAIYANHENKRQYERLIPDEELNGRW